MNPFRSRLACAVAAGLAYATTLHADAGGPLSLRPVLTLADVPPALVLGSAPPAPAPEQTDGPPRPAEEPAGYGITGNWGGARDNLAKRGIYVAGYISFDLSKVVRAGLNTRTWPTSYLLDINVLADMQKAAGLTGGTAFLDFQSHDQSQNGDAAVGDVQGFDNIGAPRFVQISQLWYRQEIGENLRLKIGKIDANADSAKPGEDANDAFSLIEHGLEFIHSAPAFSPAIFPMNSYPSYAPGLELFYGHDTYAGIGAFYSNNHQTFLNIAGHPESVQIPSGGMFIIGEVGTRWSSFGGASDLPGHAAAGGWYHTGEFPRISSGGTKHGAGGAYFLIDQSLFHAGKKGEPTRDLGFFLTGGWSDKTTSPMDQNLAGGINASGFVPGRPDDSMGVMASWVHLPAQPGLLHPFELAMEVYYNIQLTQWASIKPDFQYIVSPSGQVPDAAVATVRVEIDF